MMFMAVLMSSPGVTARMSEIMPMTVDMTIVMHWTITAIVNRCLRVVAMAD
jgi:hypothetical protein